MNNDAKKPVCRVIVLYTIRTVVSNTKVYCVQHIPSVQIIVTKLLGLDLAFEEYYDTHV